MVGGICPGIPTATRGLGQGARVKRFDPNNKVGVSIVRQLYGVKTHQRATKGILATTSYLTADAEEFIDDHFWELEARDHQGIIDWVKLAVKGTEPAR